MISILLLCTMYLSLCGNINMKQILLSVLLVCFFVSGTVSVYAKQVLIVSWMDNARADKMFQKYLEEMIPGVQFTRINAKRDRNRLVKILQSFDFSKVDLVYSFGTTGTKIVKGYLQGKKPHVFNAVSTPVLSKIADSLEKPGNNLTGAKMLIDISTQIELFMKLKKIKRLAVWFDPREKQAQAVLRKLQIVSDRKGIKLYPFRIIPDTRLFDTLLTEAAKLTNEMDALYIIASASYHHKYRKLHSGLSPSLLVMAALSYYVKEGSSIALSPDEDNLSFLVADKAKRILGGENAGEIPIDVVELSNALMFINRDKLQAAGVKGIDSLGVHIVDLTKE